ncbi:hypothetical protein SAMN05216570_3421 [Dyella sp. OK004]|uniref:hypothetical protein n=1 Tax=Dyella sp. OK004 TaxID=1855292 RepID=UPI0008EC783C|nr:hypothetical protein [Dyella sp. OK004]SFS16931.1 hypothetical protein SAMN05216570_3421 [Dyella sp. OK004]
MTDEALDELVTLYRQNAREVAPGRLNARVLHAAEQVTWRHRLKFVWPWLGLALAANMAIWLTVYHAAPALEPPPAGHLTQSYLLQMDITPPLAPVTAYLLRNDGSAHTAPTIATTEETP